MSDEENVMPKSPGRPPKVKDVDRDMVWKMACMQCSLKEIADTFNMNPDALTKNFGDLIEKGRSVGKKSLRRAQFEKAINGDTRMLVWLGKQYLSQQDSPDNKEDSSPLPWED